MKVFQRVMLAFAIVASSVVVTGCTEDNSASVPAGTLPADAPKTPQDAMKSTNNMTPKGWRWERGKPRATQSNGLSRRGLTFAAVPDGPMPREECTFARDRMRCPL